MNQQREIFRAASMASALCWIAGVGGVALSRALPEGFSPEPSELPELKVRFLGAINFHPAMVLRFFGADFLFVLGYLVVFVGLYALTAERGRALAAVALGAGILTAVLDSIENAFYVVYALGARAKRRTADPARFPLLYYVTNLKWTFGIICVGLFGTIFPRGTRLERALTVLMLVFPILGAASVAEPGLLPMRGLFFVISMPLFAVYFRSRVKAAG